MTTLELWLQSILIGLALGCIYALLATGLSMAYSVTRQLHLTHGDFLTIALYLLLALASYLGIDPYLGVLIIAPVMIFLGLLVFRCVVQPLLKSSVLLTFQVYLGLIFIIENVLLIFYKSTPRAIPSFIALSRLDMAQNLHLPTYYLVAIAGSLVIAGISYWMLQKTDLGRGIRAVAYDPEAASLMGVKVARIRMFVFALAFVLIAASASLVAPWWRVAPSGGLDFTLFATVVLVVGGMGNFMGALLAGLLFGVMQSVGYTIFSSTLADIVPFSALLLMLLIRPQGILRPI
jgi:branched-chain amino acid transport system permease protein